MAKTVVVFGSVIHALYELDYFNEIVIDIAHFRTFFEFLELWISYKRLALGRKDWMREIEICAKLASPTKTVN